MKDLSPEFEFRTSRSGGKGGQNVNKVETKVELRFNVMDSALLSDDEKRKISEKCAARINDDGYLVVTSQTERSQLGNKEKCIEKFESIIAKALAPVKKRKKTAPSKAAKEKRLKKKKINSEKKESRRKSW